MRPSVFPDLLFVSFYDVAVNVAIDGASAKRSDFWQEKIACCLRSSGSAYTFVTSKYLVGLLVCVFAADTVVPHVLNVRATSAGVGMMGVMGNKGGVSVRMVVYDSPLCFVCSHLAAHRENVSGRNADFRNIIEKTVFDAETRIITSWELSAPSRPKYGRLLKESMQYNLMDSDALFWLGDLNYRIDESVSTEEVFAKIAAGDISFLRDKDQLNIERAKGASFEGFHEGVLDFLPTYKYQSGTEVYETRPEKKLRAPAWCDRILWKSKGNEVNQLLYGRAELLPSDHKPVFALFTCVVRVVDLPKERDFYDQLVMNLEFWNSPAPPVAEVLNNNIELPTVRYQQSVETTATLKNVGTSMIYWRFLPKVDDRRRWKRWVAVTPTSGLLQPECSVVLNLKVIIDKVTANGLMNGTEFLEDTLILRVENGEDYYIKISGAYQRSSCGMSLEELVLCPFPVRSLPLPADYSLNGIVPKSAEAIAAEAMKIPKELWRLVDAFMSNRERLGTVGLFATPGDSAEVLRIREQLDTGDEFSPCTPHSLTQNIAVFLNALPSPVVTSNLLPTGPVDQQSLRPWCRSFLVALPGIQYNVFIYLVVFFREILSQSQSNRYKKIRLSLLLDCCNLFFLIQINT